VWAIKVAVERLVSSARQSAPRGNYMLSFAIAASCALGLAVTESAQPLPPPSAGGPDPKLVEDLAYANRILYDQGVLDGFGHISVRHDKDSSRFLLARN